MPTLRSGVAPAVGLSLVRQISFDARGGREIQADVQRVHCVKSDRIYEKERNGNGQHEKPTTPDRQSGEDDEGPALTDGLRRARRTPEIMRELEDEELLRANSRVATKEPRSPLCRHIESRTSQREPGYDEQHEGNLDRKQTTGHLLYPAGRSSSFCGAVGKISTPGGPDLMGNSGHSGKSVDCDPTLLEHEVSLFTLTVLIGVEFHSFGAVHVAVQLRAECEYGTAWGCFWPAALKGS
ncbi:hypothetical protein DFH09DRAFT_1080450 [Mycena vulgaris]|nr:hypothetical protein DFH09DRAFT_1080450 [Mycena vulgaris]